MRSSSIRKDINILALSWLLMIQTTVFGHAPAASYLDDARAAAQWIRASAIRTEAGLVWPSDPTDQKSVGASLYAGSPGVILFFIEAYRATGDISYLNDVRAGADHLLAVLHDEQASGLYEGLSGIGFALLESSKATGSVKYRDGARACFDLVAKRARKVGSGVEWSDVTDVIAGGAGIGLTLLYAARELNEPAYRDLAVGAGRRLIQLSQPEADGLKWAMSPSFNRLMPNFSHGTAGISYFLATLYQETKSKEFLDAAEKGAKYLQRVAITEGNVCLVFHNEPEGKGLFYLGWCHGPVGTARLFYRLYKVTSDREWMRWVERCARGILASGIPEKRTPGFWNNVSQCCGDAGVADFFLSLYRVTGRKDYRDFCRRVAANVISSATRDDRGMRWVQAEHRVKPELLIAQTGYMQGAAGIGTLLLHLAESEKGTGPAFRFPDDPF